MQTEPNLLSRLAGCGEGEHGVWDVALALASDQGSYGAVGFDDHGAVGEAGEETVIDDARDRFD
jgi:hypothetical protein